MQWTSGKNAGFSNCDKEMLYLPVEEGGVNVEDQLKDENSLLNVTKKLIKLRKSSNALSNEGDIEFLNRKYNGYPLIYKRTGTDGEYLVCINPTDKKQDFAYDLKNAEVIMQNDNAIITDDEIVLAPISYVIVKLN